MKPAQTLLWAQAIVLVIACTPPAPPNSQPAPGGPAPQLGIEPGDQITSIDGPPPEGLTDGLPIVPPDETDRPEAKAIEKAIAFLLNRQSEDGGIKAPAYGVLRPGAASTALALYAIGHADAQQWEQYKPELEKANSFLLVGLREHSKVCAPDGTLDYPTYGAAMWLVANQRLELGLKTVEREELTHWILGAQLTEAHEIDQDSIQYGGWDLEATSGAKGDQLKGTNISITSFALEALQGSMQKGADEAILRARQWVSRCQNDDGGFVFHVWRRHPGNKAMWEDESQAKAISYATATCDGLRGLSYCRMSADHAQLTKASDWLSDHPGVKNVPGFELKAKDLGWAEGLRFYYYFTQAKALSLLPQEEAQRRANTLIKLLLAEQRSDGSFQNDLPRMFEDEPVLATSLALVALAEASRIRDSRQ